MSGQAVRLQVVSSGAKFEVMSRSEFAVVGGGGAEGARLSWYGINVFNQSYFVLLTECIVFLFYIMIVFVMSF